GALGKDHAVLPPDPELADGRGEAGPELAGEEPRPTGLAAVGVVQALRGLDVDGVPVGHDGVDLEAESGAQVGAVLQREDVASGATALIVEVVVDVAVEIQRRGVELPGERRLRGGGGRDDGRDRAERDAELSNVHAASLDPYAG